MAARSIKCWERMCDRLFQKADAIQEAMPGAWYGIIDIKEYRKMTHLYEKAALISMMLETFEAEKNKPSTPEGPEAWPV